MAKPKLLDLYCKAGGAGVGYARAGFEVVGVDIEPQKNYPFPFIQMDALDALRTIGKHFDAIHASPPCQRYSKMAVGVGVSEVYDDHIPELRKELKALGRPYIIENVERSPLLDAVMLCGSMFGLRTFRHRLFECSFPVALTMTCDHQGYKMPASYSGYHRLDKQPFITCVGHTFSARDGKVAMGIDWKITRAEIAEAIPPAYTQFIGTTNWQSAIRLEGR